MSGKGKDQGRAGKRLARVIRERVQRARRIMMAQRVIVFVRGGYHLRAEQR